MLRISDFIKDFPKELSQAEPWEITQSLPHTLRSIIETLDDSYLIKDGIAIHKTATIESGVILKAPIIIGKDCFIAAHAYLRGGVYLADTVTVGPGCEVKTSIILSHSTAAHFNFIGDSIIGTHVNFEAGAIIANYHNDRSDKSIVIHHYGEAIPTNTQKFGALIGDHCKIGANAVLSPGTVLPQNSIVKRLELIDQSK